MSAIETRDTVQEVIKTFSTDDLKKQRQNLEQTNTAESNLVVVVINEELFKRSLQA